MTSDSDAAPERPATASAPPLLPAGEHRAIDAAVAGVAGLLVGRALFGRGGGLVAGLAAVGAGLLAKRRPGTKEQAPAASPLNNSPASAEATPSTVLTPGDLTPVPETHMRLETGKGTIDDGWVAVSDGGLPAMSEFEALLNAGEPPTTTPFPASDMTAGTPTESEPDRVSAEAAELPEDAGSFAEMPALFGSIAPPADIPPASAPETDISSIPPAPAAVEPVVFDDSPAAGDVNVAAADELVSPADGALEKEILPEDPALSGRPGGASAPPAHHFGLLDDLPAEFAAIKNEEEPGPREDFLLIPDQSASALTTERVPPIQSVVAALSESREPFAASGLEGAPLSLGSAATPAPGAKIEEPRVPTTPPTTAMPPAKSPFGLWEVPSTLTTQVPLPVPAGTVPAPAAPVVTSVAAGPVPATGAVPVDPVLPPLAPILPPTPTIPGYSPAPPAPAGPAPDPEEIWRQAAAELTALRNAPARTFPPLPAPPAAVEPLAPAFPLLPAIPSPAPIVGAGPPGPPSDPSVPPWLRAAPSDGTPAAGHAGHDPSRDKAFLPTIKLSVPQGPQPLAARRPNPLPPDNTPPAGPAPFPPAVAPVILAGYRAEPVVSELPPIMARDPVADVDTPMPALPPLPKSKAVAATAAIPASDSAGVPAAMPPPLSFAKPGPFSAPNGDDKIFVPRQTSHRHAPEPYKRRLVTPLRVAVLAIAAAGGLGLFYKPQLKEFWDQKILGKLPAKSREEARPKPLEPASAQGDGSGVRIAPDPPPPPKSAPPAAPESTPSSRPAPPANPSPDPVPVPSPSAETPPVPAIAQPSADPGAVTIPPPPHAGSESTGPLPVSEAGARELISRLLRATTAADVKPYILDPGRVAPTLASYFSSGRAVPVASYESLLERADKSAATGRTMWLFRITTDNVPRGFPLAVEDTPDGLRTDWELFTQCRDGALQAFLANPSAPPGLYFTALKRAHIFADMLPGQDHSKFFAFEISSPALGDASVNAFIPRNTPLATRADKLYKFSTPYAPLLELTHKDGHVEITGIMRENWRTASGSGSR